MDKVYTLLAVASGSALVGIMYLSWRKSTRQRIAATPRPTEAKIKISDKETIIITQEMAHQSRKTGKSHIAGFPHDHTRCEIALNVHPISYLLDLPDPALFNVCSFLTPRDICALARTSRVLACPRSFILEHMHNWKMFLSSYWKDSCMLTEVDSKTQDFRSVYEDISSVRLRPIIVHGRERRTSSLVANSTLAIARNFLTGAIGTPWLPARVATNMARDVLVDAYGRSYYSIALGSQLSHSLRKKLPEEITADMLDCVVVCRGSPFRPVVTRVQTNCPLHRLQRALPPTPARTHVSTSVMYYEISLLRIPSVFLCGFAPDTMEVLAFTPGERSRSFAFASPSWSIISGDVVVLDERAAETFAAGDVIGIGILQLTRNENAPAPSHVSEQQLELPPVLNGDRPSATAHSLAFLTINGRITYAVGLGSIIDNSDPNTVLRQLFPTVLMVVGSWADNVEQALLAFNFGRQAFALEFETLRAFADGYASRIR